MTSVGFCTFCMMFAIVNVFHVHVAHNSVILFFHSLKDSAISLIAFG
jgi:hypothetical protein